MEIPSETSAAGNVLAASAFVAPMLAIALSYVVKPKVPAFFLALSVSGALIVAATLFAQSVMPGEGTNFGAAVVGGWSAALSLVMTGLVLGVRTLSEHGAARDAAEAAEAAESPHAAVTK